LWGDGEGVSSGVSLGFHLLLWLLESTGDVVRSEGLGFQVWYRIEVPNWDISMKNIPVDDETGKKWLFERVGINELLLLRAGVMEQADTRSRKGDSVRLLDFDLFTYLYTSKFQDSTSETSPAPQQSSL
jgi:hypothetical protein